MSFKSEIDEIGRIVLPVELQKEIGCSPYESLELDIRSNKLELALFEEKSPNYKPVRSVDEMGRIVLPIEMRGYLNFETSDKVKIEVKKVITISKIL
jgi:bifunctional DNA-binding transcriptional regulator/antitoxin component of YhaV-PrlF toxin-antitoxin module